MAEAKIRAVARRSGNPPEAEPGDDQLLARCGARDDSAEAAFAALIRRHGPMVQRVCGQVLGDRHDAEDAFQACFLVLARKSGSIRRPELLGNWLYGVALRTAREVKQRDGRRRRREAPASEVVQAAAGGEGRSEAVLIGREELAALHEEVARLPERYRAPLVLCELEGLTYQEAARRLQCPVGTVGVRLFRARERLRASLIRRGIAPAGATALAYTCFGEGTAATLSTTLVAATARAAAGLVAGDAVATGAIPAAILALVGAVLRGRKGTQLKAAASGVLAVGLAVWPGLVGGLRPGGAPTGAEPIRARPVAATGTVLDLGTAPVAPVATGAGSAAPPPDPAIAAALAAPGRPGEPAPALAGLRRVGRDEVARGEMLFFKDWAANDPTSPHGDGLGPVFNESSCVACHGLGAPGGGGPANKNVILLTAAAVGGKLPKGLDQVLPGFKVAPSTVLHRYGTDPAYDSWRRDFLGGQASGSQKVAAPQAAETVAGRIARVAQGDPQPPARGRFRSIQVGPGTALRVSERNSPALFGAGQVDAIPAEALAEQASWEPAAVRGRVNRSRDGRVGRFGWKAQVGNLHDFVRSACAGELGLEVPGHAQGASPLAPLDAAKGLDLTQADCDALVAFVRALPAPVAVDPDGPLGTADMAAGRHLFAEVGCASCHAPSLGEVRGIYSDLLLHDLGPALNDSGSYYGSSGPGLPDDPTPGEWRTPPLWGFRDSAPYLHDGRAEDLDEAVALHGGQAAQAAHQFFALDPADRDRIETFLKSLVAPAATAAPGIVLAADREARAIPDQAHRAEAAVRRERERAEADRVREQEAARRREVAEAAARRAQRNFQLAVNLERAWKTTGAMKYYREVVREAPDTEEGRVALERIADLSARTRGADRP